MRKVFIVLASFLVSYVSIAQPPTGENRPAGGGRSQLTGTMFGKLIEAKSMKPIEYASVQLLQSKFDSVSQQKKDVVIAGMLSKANGEFVLENVPAMGQFKFQVSVVGYKPYEQTVSFGLKPGDMSAMGGALDKDLGNIKVDIEDKVLENVTITADRPGLQLGIDRKVFNVDKNLVSVGGTAVDIMRNVPSLNVDIDGNVSLRNNSPQIFVDGRPTTMELDQIPADAIESVEIITNPSAKFDASGGTAGILNIVLKKNRKVGYNGSIRTNLDSRGRIGLGGDINVRQNKINVFFNGNFNQRKSISNGTTDRLYLLSPQTFSHQNDKSTMNGSFKFIRTGIDYFITNRTTLSGSLNLGKGSFNPGNTTDVLTDKLDMLAPDSFARRTSKSENEFRNIGTSLNFKHNFPKAGREWTADVTYNSRKNDNDNLLMTDIFNPPSFATIDSSYSQRQIGNGNNKNVILQTDFVNPLSEKSKIEMGVRAAFNNNSSTNAFYSVDPGTGSLVLIPSSQVNYESNDKVVAAYGTFTNRIKNFGYQLGLRAESSTYEGTLSKTNQRFNIDYALSFFPSVFLSQKLKNDQELQLNYSRRINRPNFWQLTPFIDSSDLLNPSVGNPGLNPEFTNSIEVSYQKTFKKNRDNLLLSVYYKNTNDLITRYQVPQEDTVSGKTVILNTYINANASYVTGLEATLKTTITKWWELSTNVNLFTSKIDINDPAFPEQDQFASWFAKLNNSFKLSKKLTFQLSGSYQSKSILPPGGGGGGGGGRGGGGMFGQSTSAQGYVRPVYYMDAAIRYTFMKENRASLSLNMNDVLRTRVSDVHSESPFFIQDVFRRRDPQILRLNFSWRFGKFDTSLFKRKNNKQQDDPGAGDGMNVGQ